MTTSITFKRPKDPRSTVWRTIVFGVALTSVGTSSVSCTVSSNPSVPSGASEWTTAGDAVAGSPLAAVNVQLTADKLGVTFQLTGGVPGTSYAVCAEAVGADGSDLFGSIIQPVSGQ